jgi:hypothetical protein
MLGQQTSWRRQLLSFGPTNQWSRCGFFNAATVAQRSAILALDQLANSPRSQLFGISASGSSFSGAPASMPVSFQTFATSQKIDQLSGVAISGGSLTGTWRALPC